MSTDPKVSVIILNYNTVKWLQKFLPVLMQKTQYDNLEVIVADNHSADGSIEFVRKNFPSIKTVYFEKNFGFAEGNNRAIAALAEGEYIVLLNSDIEVSPRWLDTMVAFMEQHPDAAACQPKILSYRKRNEFEYAGAAGGFIDQYGYVFCRGRFFEVCEEDHAQYDSVKEVFWASGACMMIRRSVWRQIGGLDDDFFMHMEEIDWCWRAHLCGYKLYCVPQSVVYHVGAGTLTKQNPRKTYFNYRNNLLMLQKNLSCVTAWRVLLFRLILDHLSLYRHLAHGHFAICTGILLAHRDFLVHQPKWVRKRMANQKFLRNVNPQVRFGLDFPRVVYNGDIVVDHFLKQKESFSELKL